jgi:DNA-binding transcriptional ArsR family regulator
MKSARELEKIVKGFANHRRIDILLLLERRPELSVFDIVDEVGSDFRTVSEHLRKLTIAGLLLKRRSGRYVCHTLTSRGKFILSFCRMTE